MAKELDCPVVVYMNFRKDMKSFLSQLPRYSSNPTWQTLHFSVVLLNNAQEEGNLFGPMQVNPLRMNWDEHAEHTPLGSLLAHSALVYTQMPLERL